MKTAEKNDLIKKIQSLQSVSDDSLRLKSLMEMLSVYHNTRLPGAVLKEIFLIVNPPDEDGFSKEITIDELMNYNIGFRTQNGGDWCRSNQSALGKEYNITRIKNHGSIYAVKLEGFNKNLTINQNIRPDIKNAIQKKRCVILDVSTNVEADHKNGKKDEQYMNNLDEQSLDDFQPLSKAANIAKRSHCIKCKSSGKRYDAKRLGYAVSFTKGDFKTDNCQGCYWFDPKKFNEEVSKDFKKDR